MGCCTSTSSPRLSTRCKPVIYAILLPLNMYGVSLCFFMCMWVSVRMYEVTSARMCALVSLGVCWRVACLCLSYAGVQVNLCMRRCVRVRFFIAMLGHGYVLGERQRLLLQPESVLSESNQHGSHCSFRRPASGDNQHLLV